MANTDKITPEQEAQEKEMKEEASQKEASQEAAGQESPEETRQETPGQKEASQEETEAQEKGGNASTKEDRKSKKEKKKAAETAKDQKIADLEAKVAKEKDDYLRLMAEFDNFRRRTAQERLELINNASESVIKGLLPILDDFERALKVLGESTDSTAAKEGTELIYNKMLSLLKSQGVESIDALGKQFDTDLHEAVAQFPVDEADKKGKVYDVVQSGYTLHGKVIRFAKVVVAI